MSEQSLMVRDDSRHQINFTPEAVEAKEQALAAAEMIFIVDSPMTQELAVDAQKALRRLLKTVEDARKIVKAPLLDFGRAIDTKAKDFVAEVESEELRIAKLVGDYQTLELARVRAAEAARLAEQRRLEEEKRREEERIRREEQERLAEQNRQRLELERKAREAKDEEERKRIEVERAEIERQQKLAAAQSHAELDRINEEHCQRMAAVPTVAPTRVEGQIVREDWEITVTDVWALARAHPMAVNVTPRLSEIRQLLDAGVKVPGVTAKKVPKSSVRLGREPKAIEVGA